MPFPRNLGFVGRSDDLESLHAVLKQKDPVGIRPAGLTGMGGIGKTQLAVEYVYHYKRDYPDGIFWVNAAEPLPQGLAQVACRLRSEVQDKPPNQQLRAAFEELTHRENALVVFDNLEDPAQLLAPLGTEGSPLTLACHILFTTRKRELGPFQPVEVSILPEEPALQLLLSHPCRHAIRDNPNHPEYPEAQTIGRLLGWLPLALELASAYLGEWPDIPLAGYRQRLREEGCLPTLDTEVENLAAVNFQPIHQAAVAATLKTPWEALKQGEETARLLLRVAGQFSVAAAIPTTTLGLFAGVSQSSRPGHPSPLKRALKRLHDVRLIEELHENRIRLHPLVREFAATQTPLDKTPAFRQACARRVVRASQEFTTLDNHVRSSGMDGLQQTLLTALEFASGTADDAQATLTSLLRLFRREAHHLRDWDPERQPGYFAQQVSLRALDLGDTSLATQAERRLTELSQPGFVLQWRTHRDSPALAQILTGHQDTVKSVAVSPDGRHIVSGSEDRTVAVWDLATGRRRHTLSGHKREVMSVAVSPDGRHIVSGSSDRTVAVWDLATGQRRHTLTGHQGKVMSVAVSPDGRHIVSGSIDRTVAVWDLATGQRRHTLTGHQGTVMSVAVSPDGRHIVSGSEDRTVAVWDLATGQRRHTLTGHQDKVMSVAVSPDGRHIVSGSEDRTVAVWDLATGQRRHTLTGHQDKVWSVAVSPDGRHIVSGSDDQTVAVWDLATGQRRHTLTGHQGKVWSVAVSPDGRHIVSGSDDQTVAVWDLATGQRRHTLTGHQDKVMSVAVSPDGRHIVSGSEDRTVAVWDLATGQRRHTLSGHQGDVNSVAVSPDGRHIVSGSEDRTVAVWDLATGQRRHTLTGHRDKVMSVAVSPDGRHIVSGSKYWTVAVWDLATGQRRHTLSGHQDGVNSVAVSPDGRHIVSGSEDRTVAVWDLATGRRRHTLSGHEGGVNSVAVSPDGRHIVSGSEDRTVAVWDLAIGRRRHTLSGHEGGVNSVAVSPDGRHIVSGSEDRTVAVWDLATGQRLATVSLDVPIRCLTWRAEDHLLVVGDSIGDLYCLQYCEP